jgi:hypothetical protein
MRIELVTKDGQHVAWVEIPPFQTMPDIVAWGDRTFTVDLYSSAAHSVYREAFAVVSLTPSPGLPEKP